MPAINREDRQKKKGQIAMAALAKPQAGGERDRQRCGRHLVARAPKERNRGNGGRFPATGTRRQHRMTQETSSPRTQKKRTAKGKKGRILSSRSTDISKVGTLHQQKRGSGGLLTGDRSASRKRPSEGNHWKRSPGPPGKAEGPYDLEHQLSRKAEEIQGVRHQCTSGPLEPKRFWKKSKGDDGSRSNATLTPIVCRKGTKKRKSA